MGYIRWLGHASFEIRLDGVGIAIDPWLKDNPKAPIRPQDLTGIELVLVTHDHGDHYGDAIEVAKRNNATVVAIYEIAQEASSNGVKAVGMNVGGPYRYKDIEVYMVQAYHSSCKGSPVGYIIRGKEATIYHAGDTGLFSDISLYAKLYPIDYALVPIGGHFTMNEEQAALFVSLFKPRYVIPMHYGTFPLIEADPELFKKRVEQLCPQTRVVILKPSDSIEISKS